MTIAFSPIVNDGTVSVSNGGTTVTGVGTTWLTDGLQGGDQFKAQGLAVTIQSITDNTHMTILAWPGTTIAAGNYEVLLVSDASRLIAANSALAQALIPNLVAMGGLAGAANEVPIFTGAGALSLLAVNSDVQTAVATAGKAATLASLGAAAISSDEVDGVGLKFSVGSSQLTCNLVQADGATNPSATVPAYVSVRSAAAGSGAFNRRSVTSSLSLIIPSGATLGHANATPGPLYWYVQDNAGTLELAVCATEQGDNFIGSSTTISSGATSASTIYATTGRSNVPMRKIGESTDTQTTAGTWAAVPSSVKVGPFGAAQSEFFKTLKSPTTAAAHRTALGSTTVGDAVFIAANAAAAQAALGLGTAATQATGTSGANVPLLNGANTWSAQQTLSAALALASGQINFPATQNPSSGANVLDDYEEGTFTPTATPGVGSFTTASATGTYTKIGNMASAWEALTVTTIGTASSTLLMGGLPFTSISAIAGIGVTNGANTTDSCFNISGTGFYLSKYDGSFPVPGSGRVVYMSVSYATS